MINTIENDWNGLSILRLNETINAINTPSRIEIEPEILKYNREYDETGVVGEIAAQIDREAAQRVADRGRPCPQAKGAPSAA